MNIADLPKWLAGHRPLAAKVAAVLGGGREQSIALGAAGNRWGRIANTLQSLSAEAVHLYNEKNDLIAAMDIEYAAPGQKDASSASSSPASSEPVQLSILKDASDANALVHALAQAFSQVVKDTMTAQASTNKAAFEQLREVTKIQGEQLKTLMRAYEESLDEREEQIEQQREAIVAEREESKMMDKLVDLAGPEIVKKIMGGGAAPAAPATNGASTPK